MPNFFLAADLGLFFGRLHPLIVHLPIGFLLLAAVLEWWPGEKARPAIQTAWFLGAASAVAAAGAGWLLATESGGGDTLFWHRWLGVSVAVLGVAGVFINRKGGKLAKGFGLLVVGLLGLAGHQGGNLTHGEEYLFEHAPQAIRNVAGFGVDSTDLTDWEAMDLDSINLYHQFLQPAIDETCAKCHNGEKQNGGLRMDEPHYAFVGGETGPLLVAGSPNNSLWMKRLSLPRDNVKAMPPQGQPWDYAQIELLKYWIAEGADTLYTLDPVTTPDGIKSLLQQNYGLHLRPRQFVETVRPTALAAPDKEELEAANWSLTGLQPQGGALEAGPRPGHDLDPAALSMLSDKAAKQVVYLNLNGQNLNDADLAPLTKFANLNRLRLNQTRVGNRTVEQLKALPHLESLNLYGTAVDDEIFQYLGDFPELKRLYLWQTNVTDEAAVAFADRHPGIDVDLGYQPQPSK